MDISSKKLHCDGGGQRQPTEGTESRRDFVCFFQRRKNTHFQTVEKRGRGSNHGGKGITGRKGSLEVRELAQELLIRM